jgi:LysR family transcriptional regulator, nitrogen assimilation regulatory protein
MSLRQIRAVIAVAEERSFTRAAARENATQSGISQHVSAAERALGVPLFERAAGGVKPTAAGERYYRHCVEALGLLHTAGEEARTLAGRVTGDLTIGLMPTFTRAALAPTLERFVPDYPDVNLRLIEGYSANLTEMVLAGTLDFAVVPAFEGRTGLRSRLLVRDREMLVSGRALGLTPLAPLRLAGRAPLKIVVPTQGNVRRRNIDTYLQTNGVAIARMIEMDAMIGTLEFVAGSDWVAVLPGLICVNDIKGGDLVVNPIADPPLYAEFVVITATRRTLGTPARIFLDYLEAELARIRDRWRHAAPERRHAADRPIRRSAATSRRSRRT